MPPPIPPFEPQVGIALTTRLPAYLPPTAPQSVSWDSIQQYDLGVPTTLPTQISVTVPYYFSTYSKTMTEKPTSTESNSTKENAPTSAFATDPYHIPMPTTQMPAMAAETAVLYWENGIAAPDWAQQQRLHQAWWGGPHLKHVSVGKLWPLIVICILLLVVAVWLAVPGFPFNPF